MWAAAAAALALTVVLGASLAWSGQPAPPAATWATAQAPTPSTPTPQPGPRRVTVLGGGDILIHPPVWEQARADAGGDGLDFYPILAGVAEVVSGADLAICHLETPLAPAGGPYLGWPRFSAPPQVVAALVRAGYDGCSTASNHTLDHGQDGVSRTIDALDGAGLSWAGSARSTEEAARPRVVEVATADGRTVRIGHLAYTFGFNGLLRPPGREWVANLIDPDRIVAEAGAARDAGAEIVVVSLHWGEEYRVEPTGGQVALAEQLLASTAIDLILGHHAHVVQPVEQIDGHWVYYGLGNQIARHAEPIDAQREGLMARVTFVDRPDGWVVEAVEAVPTWVELRPRIRLVDLAAELAAPDLPSELRRTYQAAYDRIASAVYRRGADRDGLRLD